MESTNWICLAESMGIGMITALVVIGVTVGLLTLIGTASEWVAKRTGMHEGLAIAIVSTFVLGAIVGLVGYVKTC